MSEYQLKKLGGVIRLSDNAHIPCDPLNRDWAEYESWLAEGNTPRAPFSSPEEVKELFSVAIQKLLDDFARTRNYDGILSAATYATSAVAKFKAEGQYAVEARDATWVKSYEILKAAQSGTRAVPTFEELMAELPPLVWPQ